MLRASLVAIALVGLSSSPGLAEENASFRTALSVVGGLSFGASDGFGRFGFGRGSDAGFAVGGGIAHDLTPRLVLEATGLYLDRAAGAWSADAGFRLNLTPANHSVVPYFAASGGVYSERSRGVDAEVRAFGPDLDPRSRRNQTLVQPGRGVFQPVRGGMVVAAQQPQSVDLDGSRRTDGVVSLGGGVRFDAGPHVFVRPDVRAQLVFSGDTRVLGLFTLNFGYRF